MNDRTSDRLQDDIDDDDIDIDHDRSREFRQGKIKVSIERDDNKRKSPLSAYSKTPEATARSRFQYPPPVPRAKSYRTRNGSDVINGSAVVHSPVHREPSRKRKKKKLKKRRRQRHRHTIHSEHTAKTSYDDMDLREFKDIRSDLRTENMNQSEEVRELKPAHRHSMHPRKPTPYIGSANSQSASPRHRYRSSPRHKSAGQPPLNKHRSLWSLNTKSHRNRNGNRYRFGSDIASREQSAPTPAMMSDSDATDVMTDESSGYDDPLSPTDSGMITPIHNHSHSGASGISAQSGDSNHSGIPVWNPLMVGSSPLPQTIKAMEAMEVMEEMKESTPTNMNGNVHKFVTLADQVEDLKQSINYMKKVNQQEMENMNKSHQKVYGIYDYYCICHMVYVYGICTLVSLSVLRVNYVQIILIPFLDREWFLRSHFSDLKISENRIWNHRH